MVSKYACRIVLIVKQNIIVPIRVKDVGIGLWSYTSQNLEVGYNIFYQTCDTCNTTRNLDSFSSSNIDLTNHLDSISIPTNTVINPMLMLTTPDDLHIKMGSSAIDAADPNFKTLPEY